MLHSDETYIVRVRREEGDAVVEDVGSPRRRRHVQDLSELGALITDWLEPDASAPSPGAPENGGPDDS